MPIDNTKGELNVSSLTMTTVATSDDLIQILDIQSDGQGAGKAISVGNLFAGGTAASASNWLQSSSVSISGSAAGTASIVLPVNVNGVTYYLNGYLTKNS